MTRTWTLREPEPEAVRTLTSELDVSALTARLLVNRGIQDPDDAHRFLHPRFENLHDPFLMKDMDRAVPLIWQALEGKKRIMVHGDYDVDGITSSLILKRALEILGGRVAIHIPRRLKDGYGIRTGFVERCHRDGVGLLVTSDCGIRAFEACGRARELGLDVLVCDHHLPAPELPPARAILNPHRADCHYPDKNLSAAGVVFKLVQGLFKKAQRDRLLPHFLKVVALGTAADMVPLTGENRILVKLGLEGLAQPHNVGLRALLDGAGVSGEVELDDVAFRIAPRINAVTRMGGGPEILDLFDTRDRLRAQAIVRDMNSKNRERRRQEEAIMGEIHEWERSRPELFRKTFIVVAGRDWHRGVIGIVASRVARRFFRPALVLSIGESDCQGSGRSIPGFHLLEALETCGDLLDRYGGHAQAVGCSMEGSDSLEDRLLKLSDRLDSHARSVVSPEDLTPLVSLDSYLRADHLSFSLYRDIQRLAPFGVGNPVPVFATKGLDVTGGPWVLKNRHLKVRLGANGAGVDAIWWKNGDAAATIPRGSKIDVAYTLNRNEYRGVESLLMTVQDLRTHPIPSDSGQPPAHVVTGP